jgi:methionyl aminopeptidase
MITILSKDEISKMIEAGLLVSHTLHAVGTQIKPGVSTNDIDRFVYEYTIKSGGTPSQLGYKGFPKSVCTSVNDVVCHGIPGPYLLKDGDIINVDITSSIEGYHGDTSATFFVGQPSQAARKVVEVARESLNRGIAQVRGGARLGDIGAAIQEYVESQGCSLVKEYCGHGIGSKMHLPPFVPHYGTRGMGLRLKPGMCITIEPMVNLGHADVRKADDGWTVLTVDGSLSAQFEHTLLVTDTGCHILTQRYTSLPNSEI